MATTTSRGYPYPEDTDVVDAAVHMQALATAVDSTPGVATLTESQRNALTGTAKWVGRVVWNATAGRIEVWSGGGWRPVAPGAWVGYTPSLTWSGCGFTWACTGVWTQTGKTISVRAKAVVSSGTVGSPTGSMYLSLPDFAANSEAPLGLSAWVYSYGAAWYTAGTVPASDTTVAVGVIGGGGLLSPPGPTSPITWKQYDTVYIAGTYEALYER